MKKCERDFGFEEEHYDSLSTKSTYKEKDWPGFWKRVERTKQP